ncbi:MAG: hypothetical protein KDD25_09890, partial [Bdellovibrionales bacterium]|nr:hypothetical protein [Bdellovibrionales bacterium]
GFVRRVLRNSEKIAKGVDGRNTIWASATEFKGKFPEMPEKYLASFEDKVFEPAVIKEGSILVQGQNLGQSRPGKFFGSRESGVPRTVSEGEELWFIQEHGKRAEVVKGYMVTKDIPVYYGKVANGVGDQFLVPEFQYLSDSLKEVFEVRTMN